MTDTLNRTTEVDETVTDGMKSISIHPDAPPQRPRYNKKDFDILFNMTIEMIDRDKILSDTSANGGAQRIKDASDEEKLYNNFNVFAFNPVKLSYRKDGDYYLNISGQTREGVFGRLLHATGDERFKKIPAIVFHGLSRSEEAEILLCEDRGQKRFTKAEVFYAARAAGDIECQQIYDLCYNYGIEISNTGRKKSKKDFICAVAGLWDTTSRYGQDALQAYLELYARLWDGNEASSMAALTDEMLRGGIRFFRAVIDTYRTEKNNPHYSLKENEWESIYSRFDNLHNNPDKIASYFHEESEFTDNRTLYAARSFLKAANAPYARRNDKRRLKLPSIERSVPKKEQESD